MHRQSHVVCQNHSSRPLKVTKEADYGRSIRHAFAVWVRQVPPFIPVPESFTIPRHYFQQWKHLLVASMMHSLAGKTRFFDAWQRRHNQLHATQIMWDQKHFKDLSRKKFVAWARATHCAQREKHQERTSKILDMRWTCRFYFSKWQARLLQLLNVKHLMRRARAHRRLSSRKSCFRHWIHCTSSMYHLCRCRH